MKRLKRNQYMLNDQMSVFFTQLCQPPLSFVSAYIYQTFAGHTPKTVHQLQILDLPYLCSFYQGAKQLCKEMPPINKN